MRNILRHSEAITAALAAVLCIVIRRTVPVCIILGACILLLILQRYIKEAVLRRKLRQLTDYITAVQDRLELPDIKKTEEGALGILQSEIYKVVSLLRELYSSERRQKLYMADMLSDISHQIKTPLTAIQVMTELLEATGLDEERRIEYAGRIDVQLSRITWLIRNILTLSRLEAGVLELRRDRLELRQIICGAVQSLEVIAELREVDLDISEVGEGVAVTGDSHWLAEAFMNIIKNCIEHTQPGGRVEVSASDNRIYSQVVIRDNGSGISGKDLPHIFERFYKADNTSPTSVGIGLAMARQIISSHNGVIEVQSALGEGSTFTVKLYQHP